MSTGKNNLIFIVAYNHEHLISKVIDRIPKKILSDPLNELLIIDDEQKFGVKQKEHLRQLKSSLDVLSLSATPIPRTVYLALSSFKDISLMQTPPEGRFISCITEL